MDLSKRFLKYDLKVLKKIGTGTYGLVDTCSSTDTISRDETFYYA